MYITVKLTMCVYECIIMYNNPIYIMCILASYLNINCIA
jgi:hypothetical protein